MIESITGMVYGRITTEIVYKDGQPVTNKQKAVETFKTPTKQILLDTFFEQLRRMENGEITELHLKANPATAVPDRFEAITESYLE